jgi:hypothetical protein
MWHALVRRENSTRFWGEALMERDHSEGRDVDESVGSEWILERLTWGCSGFHWLRIETGGWLL